MGNKNSNKMGSILIRTDQPYYLSGDIVTGNIYLDCRQEFPTNKIILIIEGRQQSWWKVQQKDKKNPKNQGFQTFKHFQGENILYSNFISLHQTANKKIQKGQYIFPFAFKLGSYLPGTFYQQKNNYKGHIFYKLHAQCSSYNKQFQLKNTQILVIRQPQKQYQRPMYGQITMQPITCCCCKQGRSKIKCYFDKNSYLPKQQAIIICQVDNLNCDVNIKKINCSLIKQLQLISNQGGQKIIKQVITQIKFPGIQAGKAFLGESAQKKALKLDYRSKQYQIQPSTDGRLVKCQYFLEIKAELSGCVCCFQIPSVTAPIKVLCPPIILGNIQQPIDWKPEIFEKKFVLFSQKNAMQKTIGLNPYIVNMNNEMGNNNSNVNKSITSNSQKLIKQQQQ